MEQLRQYFDPSIYQIDAILNKSLVAGGFGFKVPNPKKAAFIPLYFSVQVTTKAPLECMCRPCGSIEESAIIPQEIAGYSEEGPLHNHFRKTL